MHKHNLSTYGQLTLGMAVFGSGLPVSKLVSSAFPVFIASELRMLIAFMVISPFIFKDIDKLLGISRRDYGILFLIALFGLFLFSVTMLYGMKLVSGVMGSMVMSTTPVVTAIGSILFFKDKLTRNKIFAIISAVIGVMLIQLQGHSSSSTGSANNSLLGILLIFIAVCCEAAYTLFGKKATKDLDSVKIAGLASLIAVVLFLPFAVYQSLTFDFREPSIKSWLALIWFGAGSMSLGTVIWYKGVQKVQGSIAAGFMGIMPLSALLLSYGLLGESFYWIHAIGMGLELLALYFITKAHSTSEKAAS